MPKVDPKFRFAKRSLGQNFLVDDSYIEKIIDAVDPLPNDTIIEIGPGRGAITEPLVRSGADVIAIELDTDLAALLHEKFREEGKFRVFENDALSVDLTRLALDTSGPQRLKLVANLPYYISTAILQHLAGHREVFSTMTLMFQKEVVDRITASPGTSERGFLTVLTEAAFDVRELFDVPPTAFRPVPKVWSSIVTLTPKPLGILDTPAFRDLISRGFSQKRKTLFNNLRSKYPDIREPLKRSGIDEKRRAESLSLDEWTRLAREIG